MTQIRIKSFIRKSKYGVRHTVSSFTRKKRPKKFKRIKVYPKIYKFKAKRDNFGQWRGLKHINKS